MSEAPPRTLGKYQIRKELGKGAMGVVYTGFDPTLEREVALKVMASTIVSDEVLKGRFEREARSVAKLQHPNIVTVYDLGTDDQGDGAPFIAMELLKGSDLEGRIRKDPPNFREKLEIVSEVCRGLAHAHKNGIVHRDVKPANVFVTESGEVKIMDFGVAHWAKSTNTQTGQVLGTADYMSPEQLRGQKVDGRSDIFSVGVILYRLLTNKKPFAGESIQAVFFKILNQEAPALQLPDGQELPELQAIVDKALCKDPDERYANASDLADDLLDLIRLYEDVVAEHTVFDTMYDPAAVSDDSSLSGSSAGSGARKTSAPAGRVFGSTGSGSMGRRGTTATGRSSGVAGGRTAVGPTSAGRTAAARSGMARPAASRAPTMSGTRTGIGIPLEESSRLPKILLGVLALGGLAVGGYWFGLRGESAPTLDTRVPDVAAAALTAEQVETFLSEAEGFLSDGELNRAMNRVDEVLKWERDNPRAKELWAQIQARQDEAQQDQQRRQGQQGQVAEVAPPPQKERLAPQTLPPSPEVAPSAPAVDVRASKVAMDATMAIGDGDFPLAQRLISDGRRLTPNDLVWSDLSDRLQRAKLQADSEAKLAVLLTEASRHLGNRDYDAAIRSVDDGLAIDPNNAQLAGLRAQAAAAADAAAAELKRAQAAPVLSERRFEWTATEYTPGTNEVEAPKGFDMGAGQEVKRATAAPRFPGEIDLAITPPNAQIGHPYLLQISLNNRGNDPVNMQSLEIVSTYNGKTTGRGQKLNPKSTVVAPNGTAVVWEIRGTWNETQNSGSITTTIFLAGGAALAKTMSW